MKKKLFGMLTLLLALFLLCACAEQKEEPSVEDPPATPFQNVYDDGGNLLVEYLVDDDGTYKGKKEYLYEEGQMKKRTYDETDKLIEEVAEEYDAQGNLIKSIEYDKAIDFRCETVYTYDDGKMTGNVSNVYVCGELSTCWEFNAEGLVRGRAYTDGRVSWFVIFEYENGRKKRSTDSDGNMDIYHYDENGKQTGYTTYDRDGHVIEETVYNYKDSGLTLRTANDGSYAFYYFDENGREIGSAHYDAEGNLLKEYIYT